MQLSNENVIISCGKLCEFEGMAEMFDDPLDLLVVSLLWDVEVVEWIVKEVPALVAGVLNKAIYIHVLVQFI